MPSNALPENPKTSYRTICTIAAVVLLSIFAFLLRMRHLGDTSLWFDEGASVQFATIPMREWLRFLWHGEANMMPYYLLLRAWIPLRHSDTFVRLLSVLFGTATVPLVYKLAQRSAGALAGIIAAGLLAVHSFHVSYSQEARSYSMVIFLLCLSWLILGRLVEKDDRRQRWFYLVTAGLAIYSHFFAGFVIVAQWFSIYCFAPPEASGRLRRLQWMTVAIAMPAILYGLAHRGSLRWIPPVDYGGVLYSTWIFCGNTPRLANIFELLTVCAIAIAVVVVIKNGRSVLAWNVASPICWLLITPGLMLAISIFKPVFVARYLSLALPALVIMAAMVLVKLRPLAGSALALVLAYMLLQVTLVSQSLDQPRQDWRGAARYLTAHAASGDGAIFYWENGRASFDWYWYWQTPQEPRPRLVYTGRDPEFTWATFRQRPDSAVEAAKATQPQHLWLVISSGETEPEALILRDQLASVYQHSCKHELEGVIIVQYGKDTLDCGI